MTSSWYLNDRLFAFGFGAGRCTILDDGFNGIFLVKVGMWFAFSLACIFALIALGVIRVACLLSLTDKSNQVLRALFDRIAITKPTGSRFVGKNTQFGHVSKHLIHHTVCNWVLCFS